MKLSLHHSLLFLLFVCFIASCTEPVEHTAPAVRARDSVAVMTSWGVNTLISDSGVIKYRIVTENGRSMKTSDHQDGSLRKASSWSSLTRSFMYKPIYSATLPITTVRTNCGNSDQECV